MNNRQMMLTTAMSSLFTLTIIAGLLLFIGQAMAAPPAKIKSSLSQQTITRTLQYVGISGLAFNPAQSNIAYNKDVQNQLLSLTSQVRNPSNIFVAPLILPDRSELMGMTVFGEDADNQGEVRMRVKRCNHGQAFCVILAETTSTLSYAAGQFETASISVSGEVVDNRFYSYFLELDLTALGNSGLRSVRLDVITNKPSTAPGAETPWSLTGNVRSFKLPNTSVTHARICTDDLSHLPNPTHYPFVVIDNQILPLSSDMCVTVSGRNIEIRRDLNTGPSSGTYQFLN